MLSRTSVFSVIIICALLVGGVSLFVHYGYDQDQVAADEAIEQGALAMMASLAGAPVPGDSPVAPAALEEFCAKLRSEQPKPFLDRSPVRWNNYEFLYDADKHLLIGRPKFYGRGFWLTVAVIAEPASKQLHFYVNDAGGRWGVEVPGLAMGPEWHEIKR